MPIIATNITREMYSKFEIMCVKEKKNKSELLRKIVYEWLNQNESEDTELGSSRPEIN